MDRTQQIENLEKLAKLIRYYIIFAVNEANSGHTTTSLSATDSMTTLFFGGFLRYDLDQPDHPNNDRIIFSKGHASPLFYALFAAAGRLTQEDLAQFRSVGSPLEGHPTTRFEYTEVPTGSLGQGLSVGVGMAYNARYFDKLPYKTYVLLGDGEMAEGQVWEALSLASHYNLDNLIAVVDVNRLGQTVETQYGWDMEKYEARLSAFGWATRIVDGHDLGQLIDAYTWAQTAGKPAVILTQTRKGKGVAFWENLTGWHSKPVPRDRFDAAVEGLGEVDFSLRGEIARPQDLRPAAQPAASSVSAPAYKPGEKVATKLAAINAVMRIAPMYPEFVVLDGDVQNSTHTELFAEKYPDQFIECYIAEQNMASIAQGLARRGKIPFVVTFSAFLTRAFDQFRMSAVGSSPLRVIGSYVGASIGKDGPSNMGLEDLAMFRAIHDSIVLYPADAYAAEKLTELIAAYSDGLSYLRTARENTPQIYTASETFVIGGSKTLRQSESDVVTIVAAGVTLFEALTAYETLKAEGIHARIVDLYSVKPVDEAGLRAAAAASGGKVVVVEDHWFEGGLGDAVLNGLATMRDVEVHKLAITQRPVSGEPNEVLAYVGIDHAAIVRRVREIVG